MSASALALLLALALPASAGDLGSTARFPAGASFTFQVAPMPNQLGSVVFETGESAPIAQPFDTVLFQGQSPDAGLTFEASRRLPNGSWSAWQSAYVRRTSSGRFWGRVEFPAVGAGTVRLRAADDGVGSFHSVDVYSVETFRASDTEGSGSAPAPSAPARPQVHSRSEWQAGPPKEDYTPMTPYRITLHHTSGPQTRTLQESLAEAKFIQDFHQNGRGWNDIAYHFLIDAAGNVIEGRPELVQGAHTLHANEGNVGIVILGTYHPPKNDPVSPASLDAAAQLMRYLVAQYRIDPKTLKGHRDYKQTDCPGDELYPLLSQLRARISVPTPAPTLGISAKPLTLVAPAFQ